MVGNRLALGSRGGHRSRLVGNRLALGSLNHWGSLRNHWGSLRNHWGSLRNHCVGVMTLGYISATSTPRARLGSNHTLTVMRTGTDEVALALASSLVLVATTFTAEPASNVVAKGARGIAALITISALSV